MTPKQQAFVDEYLIDLNATQAAIRAGYKPDRAYSTGHENLSKPEIAAAIEKARAERSQRTKIDADWVLSEAQDLYRECRDNSERNTAKATLEMIGKHVGIQAFADKLDLSGVPAPMITINRPSGD